MKNINIKMSLVPVLLLALAAISSASGDHKTIDACKKDPVVKEAKPGCERAERLRQCVETNHGTAKEVNASKAHAGKACGG